MILETHYTLTAQATLYCSHIHTIYDFVPHLTLCEL